MRITLFTLVVCAAALVPHAATGKPPENAKTKLFATGGEGDAVAAAAFGGSPSRGADLTGHWNVISKPGWPNTCGTTVGTSVYQWMIAQNGRQLSVTVLGETSFPKLVGQWSGSQLLLDAASQKPTLRPDYYKIHPSSAFLLRVKDKKLVGDRFYIGLVRVGSPSKLRGCITRFRITATRQ